MEIPDYSQERPRKGKAVRWITRLDAGQQLCLRHREKGKKYVYRKWRENPWPGKEGNFLREQRKEREFRKGQGKTWYKKPRSLPIAPMSYAARTCPKEGKSEKRGEIKKIMQGR